MQSDFANVRTVLSESGWKEPERWNRQAICQKCCKPADDECDTAGHPYRRPRVFCASLADVFEDWQGPMMDYRGYRLRIDDRWPEDWDRWPEDWARGNAEGLRVLKMSDVRDRLFRLIDATPNLDWLLLTKRPENIVRMWPGRDDVNCLAMRENVWLGTSVSDQATANEQIPQLLACRDLAPVMFLSVEPLLGPIDLSHTLGRNLLPSEHMLSNWPQDGIDWVIVGGESGPDARPCNLEWIRSIIEQCRKAGVPCWVKQLGSNPVTLNRTEVGPLPLWERRYFADNKASDPSEWPEDLRVQELPRVERVKT